MASIFSYLQIFALLQLSSMLDCYMIHHVDRCPYDHVTWEQRARNLSCPGGQPYHCIKTDNIYSPFVELCRPVVILNTSDGCLYFGFSGDARNSFIYQVTCSSPSSGCPRGEGVFNSNRLFKYPACISVPNEEKPTPLEHVEHKRKITRSINSPISTQTSMPRPKSPSDHLSSLYLLLTFAGLLILALIVCIFGVLVCARCLRIHLYTNLLQAVSDKISTYVRTPSAKPLSTVASVNDEISELEDKASNNRNVDDQTNSAAI